MLLTRDTGMCICHNAVSRLESFQPPATLGRILGKVSGFQPRRSLRRSIGTWFCLYQLPRTREAGALQKSGTAGLNETFGETHSK